MKGNESDHEALLAIKSHISADPQSVLASWNNSLHHCHWRGIICGQRHRRVVQLLLDSRNFEGTLSPFIGNLSFLRVLELSNNSFRGNIPNQVTLLHRLRVVHLMINNFDGGIPANFSRCLKLGILNISRNNLVGILPDKLASLPKLLSLDLEENSLSGNLGFGNMSASLVKVRLGDNKLYGSIPDDIGRSSNSLLSLDLHSNLLSGTIPTSLYNLSNLEQLDLFHNNLEGHLPQDIGLRLPHLTFLSLISNPLIGQIPNSLSNLSKIEYLQLGYSHFIGGFTLNGNNLPHLSDLVLEYAFDMGSGNTRDLSFVDTLANCTNLYKLRLEGNSFVGTFPISVLNFSTTLAVFTLFSNKIYGHIPFGLGKFINLQLLELYKNNLTGSIPMDVSKLESIRILDFSFNNLSGEIPYSFGNLTYMSKLYLEKNKFQGTLPKSLGRCKYLQVLHLYSNKLSGFLDVELFDASGLTLLSVGQNSLQGSLPVEISKLPILNFLDVSLNRFSGEIPTTLGDCVDLTTLDMSGNLFVGSIPKSLSPLKSIAYLDLSCNNLSGQIPRYFLTWPYLLHLNLSFNALEGEVPIDGVFANTSAVSVVGNNKLCGGVFDLHLPRCKKSRNKRFPLALIMGISIVCVLTVSLIAAMFFYFLCSQKKRKDVSSEMQNVNHLPAVSYQMLLRATDGFSSSNLLGVGGFGSVYRGTLVQDDAQMLVAVKVMNLQNRGANESFMVECNALRNIRHRNLVKIITVCSSIDNQQNDFKALVYELMPNGSLDIWLHSSNHLITEQTSDHQFYFLSLLQRLSIAIDVASALEYLHTECETLIIHCDLKPTNILLDDEMTARIGDFGSAKFLSGASTSDTPDHTSSVQVRGTVGYAAPEYGLGRTVSPEGDTYSFGIILLEMMTSKKPTDPMFNDGLNLHDFAKSALPNQVTEIADQRMLDDTNVLHPRTVGDIRKMECINSLIMVGVQCSMALPQERMSISDALNELKSARRNMLSGESRNHITAQS